MKKILLIGALAMVTAFSARAVNVITVNATAGITNVISTNSIYTTSFILNNTNVALSASFMFFDAPTVALTKEIGAYSNVTMSVVANITNTYVNYFGVTNEVVYSGVRWTTNSVAASTYSYPKVLTVVVPSNSTTTVTFPYTWLHGIMLTNSASGQASSYYLPPD